MDNVPNNVNAVLADESEKRHICLLCSNNRSCTKQKEFRRDYKRRTCPEFVYERNKNRTLW